MKRIIQCMAVAVLLAATVWAEAANQAQTFYFTPFIGGYLFDGSQNLKNRPVYGLRAGYNFTDNIGAEAALDFVRTYYTPDNASNEYSTDFFQYRVDLLYHFLSNKRFDPFFAVGLGGVRINRDTFSNNNSGAFDYGLGINYFLTDRMAIRADVRHIIYNDTKMDNNLEYGLGFSFFFGGARKAPEPVAAPVEEYRKPAAEAPVVVTSPPVETDSDNDGVVDSLDKCPGTPQGVKVDADGCPLDADKDGVPDYLDKCPDTWVGVNVDADGCPLDSDKDGVPDYLDKCPGTPQGVKVDKDGCPMVEQRQEARAAAAAVVAREMFEKGRATINIEFDTNKAVIKSKFNEELQKFGDVMKNYPDLKVIIEGHTDNVGGKAYNQKLSEKRANSVRAYLIKTFGIEESRLTAKGYGMSKPIAGNKTAKDRQKNRRVEAVVDYLIKK